MRLQRQTGGLVVGDDVLALRHDGQRNMVDRNRLVGKQRQLRDVRQPAHLPQRSAPIESEAAHRVGFRQQHEGGARQAGSGPDRRNPALIIPRSRA